VIPLDRKINDLRGRRFGRLAIAADAEPDLGDGHARWPCLCDCGSRTLVRGSKLVASVIVSCGCYRADPAVRQTARMQTPAKHRREIARMGGLAKGHDARAGYGFQETQRSGR
jgi:hypothetical protein